MRIAVAVFATAALSAQAGAQAGVVGGIVVSTGGAPLAAAQVRVDGTDRVTVTDAGGRFRADRP